MYIPLNYILASIIISVTTSCLTFNILAILVSCVPFPLTCLSHQQRVKLNGLLDDHDWPWWIFVIIIQCYVILLSSLFLPQPHITSIPASPPPWAPPVWTPAHSCWTCVGWPSLAAAVAAAPVGVHVLMTATQSQQYTIHVYSIREYKIKLLHWLV